MIEFIEQNPFIIIVTVGLIIIIGSVIYGIKH